MVSSSSSLKKSEPRRSSRSRILRFEGCLLRPIGEVRLRAPERFLEIADADAVLERGVAAFGEKIDLVAEVFEVVVDRRRGEQQHLGFHARLDDVVHHPLVAALADEVAFLVALAGRVVAEVVRLIDDDQVVVAPVDRREVDVAGLAGLAAQVGVREHVVAEAVVAERIELVVQFIDRPVLAQLLRAEDEHAFVAQLEVFDDRERLVGFS